MNTTRKEIKVKTDRNGFDWWNMLKVSARNSGNGIFEYCSDFGYGIIVLFDGKVKDYDEFDVVLDKDKLDKGKYEIIYDLYDEKTELVGYVYKPIKKGLWEAIEDDGFEKYDAFVSLIKNTLAPTDNEVAYEIEEKVNTFMHDMFE